MTSGKLTDRDGQPGVLPVLPAAPTAATRPPWDTEFSGDPDDRHRLRERGRLRRRRHARVHEGPGRLGRRRSSTRRTRRAPSRSTSTWHQVSYKPERAKTADLSDGYYDLTQALVAVSGTPISSATSIAALKSIASARRRAPPRYDLIKNVIAPTQDTPRLRQQRRGDPGLEEQADRRPRRRPADRLLHHGRPDGQRRRSSASSRRRAPRRSTSASCSRRAARSPRAWTRRSRRLKADGTLAKITQEWMSDKANAPVLQP